MMIAACADRGPAGGKQWKFKGDSGLAEDSTGPEPPEIDTNVPDDKIISDLNPDEYAHVCEEVSEYEARRLDLTDYCRYRAHATNYINDRNGDVAQDLCRTGTRSCIDDFEMRNGRIVGNRFGSPDDERLPRCSLSQKVDACEAPVKRWTTCATELDDRRAEMMKELPTCDDIDDGLYSDKDRLTCELPAACRKFKNDCENFYNLHVPGAGSLCTTL